MTKARKPDNISQQEWDDSDIPEQSAADFKRAKPFADVFPQQYEAWKRGRGRPPSANPKIHVGFRLAEDVVLGIKASGPGYNARVETVLRDALAKGKLRPQRD